MCHQNDVIWAFMLFFSAWFLLCHLSISRESLSYDGHAPWTGAGLCGDGGPPGSRPGAHKAAGVSCLLGGSPAALASDPPTPPH